MRHLLERMGINTMLWPPYSPDLNPIENLWAELKREIYRLYPELKWAPDTQETLDQLIQAAKEAWGNIKHDILHNLSVSMNERIEAIEEAEGWYTKF